MNHSDFPTFVRLLELLTTLLQFDLPFRKLGLVQFRELCIHFRTYFFGWMQSLTCQPSLKIGDHQSSILPLILAQSFRWQSLVWTVIWDEKRNSWGNICKPSFEHVTRSTFFSTLSSGIQLADSFFMFNTRCKILCIHSLALVILGIFILLSSIGRNGLNKASRILSVNCANVSKPKLLWSHIKGSTHFK